MTEAYHHPVMLKECLAGLAIKPGGVYVDATFGGGGHSQAILSQLDGGKLVAFDQDLDARREAEKMAHRSLIFCQANFRHLRRYLKLNGLEKADGILADLGVSSHQLDVGERGFSTRFDGPLDMRMDQRMEKTAALVLQTFSEEKLHRIFGMYGELTNARTVARRIVQYRVHHPLEKTADLKEALKGLTPRVGDYKYWAQLFQALRIEVNDELDALEEFLIQTPDALKQGGRLVVISYHSLEDRMVKNFINKGKIFGEAEKDFYGNVLKPFYAVTRKPLVATPGEVSQNKRARSAKLRVAEKL